MFDAIYIALCRDNTAYVLPGDIWYQVHKGSVITHGSDDELADVVTRWAIYEVYISKSDMTLLSYVLHKEVTEETFVQELQQAIRDGVIGIATGIVQKASQESIDEIMQFAKETNGEDK